jgi:polar amino acid transport system permease protein
MNGVVFDWGYLREAVPSLLTGLKLTIVNSLACIVLSILLGYLLATVLHFRPPVLWQVVSFWVKFIRNTPLLIQIYFFYFGMPEIGIRPNAEVSGIIVLSLWAGAYQAENLRGAIEGLPRRLIEAGRSLGLHPLRLFSAIIIPVATHTIVPAMMNTAVSTTKNTALLSAIGVPDLTYVAMDNISTSYRTMENFLALFIGYIAIVLTMSGVAHLVERRLGRGYRR